MPAAKTTDLRSQIYSAIYISESEILPKLVEKAALSGEDRARIAAKGADLVRRIRASSEPGLMEVFLAEYGLSTDEGIALMCLAEALLRVPIRSTP
jgi:RHH-type transcriptional regulator, proline utilization regulon repressor / proline dehydrogenase / delta 1-pyrroline-5-carboxylate dehydrogenase